MEAVNYSYKRILAIALPILVSVLMEQLIGMTDTAYLGRVGEVELGAAALGGIAYTVVFMLGLGFSIGVQIIIGRRNGEGAYTTIGSVFYHGLFFLLLLSLVLVAFVFFFGDRLMNSLISSPEIACASDVYLTWRMAGIPFAFITLVFRAFYIGTTNTRTLTLNSLVMVLSNVVFNYVLIFGKFGFPTLGIQGAAIGSALAEIVSFLFFLVYTSRRIDCAKYALNAMPRFRFGILKNVFDLSVWIMIQNFLSLGTWFIFFLAIEHLGQHDLAATNIIRNVSAFTFMTLVAFGSTISTLVSNFIGQGNDDSVMPMIHRVMKLTFLILVPVILLIATFSYNVLNIFTDDAALIRHAQGALYVLLSSYVFSIPAQLYLHAVSGSGNTKAALAMESVSLLIYTVYVFVAIFHFRSSLPVCWLSEFVYSIPISSLAYFYMRRGFWRKKAAI